MNKKGGKTGTGNRKGNKKGNIIIKKVMNTNKHQFSVNKTTHTNLFKSRK